MAFQLLPVFDGGNYPASVSAVDDATLLFVSKQDFQALCLAHPQVALKVLRVVGARLRRLVGIIEELSFTTVRHLLASFASAIKLISMFVFWFVYTVFASQKISPVVYTCGVCVLQGLRRTRDVLGGS